MYACHDLQTEDGETRHTSTGKRSRRLFHGLLQRVSTTHRAFTQTRLLGQRGLFGRLAMENKGCCAGGRAPPNDEEERSQRGCKSSVWRSKKMASREGGESWAATAEAEGEGDEEGWRLYKRTATRSSKTQARIIKSLLYEKEQRKAAEHCNKLTNTHCSICP